MRFAVVILAAGQGRRMNSKVPKVLHPIAGVPILRRIIKTAERLNPSQILVVYGHQGEKIKEALADITSIQWIHQAEQKGTGHAVLQALPAVLPSVSRLLILCGDVPLIQTETLEQFIQKIPEHALGIITAKLSNATGFGRIIRDEQGKIRSIVEEKDATPDQKKITEMNTGIWFLPKDKLQAWLPQVNNHNHQQEYYLPDIVKFAEQEHYDMVDHQPSHVFEILGVNDKSELAHLERAFQFESAKQLMKQGVTFADPHRFDLRGSLSVGEDVFIDINALFEGDVKLGSQVHIGPNVVIKNSVIHDGVEIRANSVVEGAIVGAGCTIGPFARVRPGTELAVAVKIGNFVEIKKAVVGAGTKINHLSYIGDAEIGQGVNIGAGTITCNYDGQYKHKTVIGDHVFVGSDTQLIAPLTVGEGATIGAGTTVVRDVPANQLIHNRIQHRSVTNWVRRESDVSN